MQYHISTPKKNTRYIEIELTLENVNDDHLELYLPAWRPGRYELGNFAKNIQHLAATDASGKPLPLLKTAKDRWKIDTADADTVIVRYNYYAAQPDAGACWLDNNLIYINPVHCCLYAADRIHLPCKLIFDIPDHWQIATGLLMKSGNVLQAADFHQLADSPVFAGAELQHYIYTVDSINFHIWLAGRSNADQSRIIPPFKAFTEVQIKTMHGFPAREYHFMILVLPYKFYHGVEHSNSTVLALGPGSALMNDDLFNDLVGVASHELFHTWNVKAIRPAEMLPYRYQEENYSRLGWVYEGFTTYYGDLFLARSGFFNTENYFEELNMRLQRHLDNYGRLNMPVAESSFDTWLDGYVAGIPNRKTSIYDEGCLVAWILDLFIRKNSSWKYSLDDVMRSLYNDFAMQNRGYREIDIRLLTEQFSNADPSFIFDRLINGTSSYLPVIQELLNEVGCYISKTPSRNYYESAYGFKVIASANSFLVTAIIPDSPAEQSGLCKDDELISVNDMKAEGNLNDLFRMQAGETILEVFEMKRKKTVQLKSSALTYFDIYKLVMMDDVSSNQKEHFFSWTGIKSE
jgi:predicted metalloprotease with PDZ domain